MWANTMRIDQILPSIGDFDAISTDAKIIRSLLREKGYDSDIYTNLGVVKGDVYSYKEYLSRSSDCDIAIYHFSIGSDVPNLLSKSSAYKVIRYHNITPSKYFDPIHSWEPFYRCREGRCQIPLIRDLCNYYWATSEYNANELKMYGYDIGSVLPVLRNYEGLTKEPACNLKESRLKESERKNILFVGRVVPHKSQHDLLYYVSQYKKYIDRNIRLICVGSGDSYYVKTMLKPLANELGLSLRENPKSIQDFDNDVLFVGGVDDQKLASFYRSADVFMCMSEHEGFCVPLVEAMFFKLPILAHSAAAIPGTAGYGAKFFDKNNPCQVLELMNQCLNSSSYRGEMIASSEKRAAEFSWSALTSSFDSNLQLVLQDFEARALTPKVGFNVKAPFEHRT